MGGDGRWFVSMVTDDVNERRRRHFLLPISNKYVWRYNWNVKLMDERTNTKLHHMKQERAEIVGP